MLATATARKRFSRSLSTFSSNAGSFMSLDSCQCEDRGEGERTEDSVIVGFFFHFFKNNFISVVRIGICVPLFDVNMVGGEG